MNHDAPQGLAVSAGGYSLVPVTASLTTGATTPFAFKVTSKDGTPVTAYTPFHDKELHFIVVRRDLAGYQHLHPTRAPDGTWTVALAIASAGVYKAFASFQPAGQPMPMPVTLAVDLMASGNFSALSLPRPAKTATVDGFKVALAGRFVVGTSMLTFTVTRAGKPVTDLEPYLGAYGHLVALRVGDLAYLHVHPEGTPDDGHTPSGPKITVHAPVPTPGAYRLYFEFKAGGVVHLAEFTAVAPQPTT